jgi:hypothetical protein
VFCLLDATVFAPCFGNWIARLVDVIEGVVAFGCKTLREFFADSSVDFGSLQQILP